MMHYRHTILIVCVLLPGIFATSGLVSAQHRTDTLAALGDDHSFHVVHLQSQESTIILAVDDLGVGNDFIQRGFGARRLPLVARYHAGDNPSWADPAFDDQRWEKGVDTWLPTESLPRQGWPGIGWFRFRMRMDPPLRSQSLGFILSHRGAVEVYLDGTLVYQSGTVGASRNEEVVYQDVNPFVLPLEAGREHVVALRYSSAHLFNTVRARWQGGTGLQLYWGDLATMRHYQSITRLIEGLYVGFFIAFSLLFGLLFVLYREERLFLYSALWNGCWALAVLIATEHMFMPDATWLMPFWGIWGVVVIGGSLALLRLLYAFFYPAVPRMFYGFLILGGLTMILVALRYDNESYFALYFILLFVEILRIVVVALWKNKRWAWIVGLGFLPIIVLGLIDMANELGWLVAPWAGTPFEPGLIDIFFLSASLSIYVGMRFADANRGLAQANRELREANQGLDEANRTLEERVDERTAELRASQAQLIQSEKMASLGQLTAGIAHEIKNPLNFVNNFASLSVELADELADELDVSADTPVAEIREDLGEILADLKQNAVKINEHGRRADGIVKSMMEHARSTPGKRRATDLNALLDEYVNLAFHGMRAQHPGFTCDIERTYDETVSELELVPQEMGRVFLNLLNNAFEAVHMKMNGQHGISTSGNIDAPTRRDTENGFVPTVTVSTRRVTDSVEIRVGDNGPGISKDLQKKIFEPFFTTKPTGKGTGLGLSLSYTVITQGHGGALTVSGEEGEGATFVVSLPLKSATLSPQA